jgi:Uncharacterized protein conserved in bacteria
MGKSSASEGTERQESSEVSGCTPRRGRGHRVARGATFCLALGSALAFISAYQPPHSFERQPFAPDSAFGDVLPATHLVPISVGRSGAVHMEFALPGARVAHPVSVNVSGQPSASLAYTWELVGDSVSIDSLRSLSGDSLVAPREPGLYRLALVADGLRRVVDGITLAVLVPFDHKKGPVLDGYRIGTYVAERRGGDEHYRPLGFVKVTENEVELPMSEHLVLGDLLSRDGQKSWPRFIAVNPRVVDKLELVVERVSSKLRDSNVDLRVSIHSGYRTPAHNRRVPRAASDSRHQYGDALDVAIDANGDGRLTARDARLVAAAVDSVEAEFPDLIGGVGVYTSSRYRQPYVHIDVRGSRVRWRG